MLNTTPMYSLKDIAIIPAVISNIKSRSECNPFYKDGMLPVFASPMSSVVNLENLNIWKENHIIPIIPRNISLEDRIMYMFNGDWIALSLKEFSEITSESYIKNNVIPHNKLLTFNLLIDVANGHMAQIYQLCEKAKNLQEKYQDVYKLNIMVGNIANSETIKSIIALNRSKRVGNYIDYVRCGIGGGACCTTSATVSVHMGMGSLLDEINQIKIHDVDNCPKIIADGGIKTYNDAITALALGADYVMIGTAFASLFESASNFIVDENMPLVVGINDLNMYVADFKYNTSVKAEDMKHNTLYIYKKYLYKRAYGMSTYVAQKEIDPTAKKRLTEGLSRQIRCVKTVKDWSTEFAGYLRSAMSYCDKVTIGSFIGNVQCRVMSPTACFNNSIDNFVADDLYTIKEK